MNHEASDTKDTQHLNDQDNLFNYTLHEEIGRGSTAVVYSATCKRGRMRNRLVAVKKISLQSGKDSDVAHLSSSTNIYQSLCHPSILSLFSSFTTPSALHHVLEYCPNGTLTEVLAESNNCALCEDELRGVVKGIVDGLIYLRKELVIHRDIKPSNILLNQHWRIKISDFGLAVKLPSETATVSTFCGSPNYVSPQIVARQPYSFPTDLWSLGALMVTCLTGTPAFEASSVPDIFRNISCASYELLATSSCEVRDLVSGLLQIDPGHRIPLHRLLSHPFFNPTLLIMSLDRAKPHHSSAGQAAPRLIPSFSRHEMQPTFGDQKNCQILRDRYPPHLSRVIPNDTAAAPHIKLINKPIKPWSTVRRDFFSDTWKPCQPNERVPSSRRFVSAPSSQASVPSSFLILKRQDPKTRSRSRSGNSTDDNGSSTPALTADRDSFATVSEHALDECVEADITVTAAGLDLDLEPLCLDTRPLLLEPKAARRQLCPSLRRTAEVKMNPVISSDEDGVHDVSLRVIQPAPTRDPDAQQCLSPATEDGYQPDAISQSRPVPAKPLCRAASLAAPHASEPSLPSENTGRPPRLNTDYLTLQTQKVLKGQVTVLPSKSLLVDFREGERRKGRKGVEVLVIRSDGDNIKVFSAPHLSSPCCLAEPIAEHDWSSLPRSYWHLYSDAAKVVNHLKERIPKLVLYKPEGQCTFMTNEPFGDVEILLTSPDKLCKMRSQDSETAQLNSHLKIRLKQERRVVEISRYIPRDEGIKPREAVGGEWTKRILPIASAGYCVDLGAVRLDNAELGGVGLLNEFLAVCAAVQISGASGVSGNEEAQFTAPPLPQTNSDRDTSTISSDTPATVLLIQPSSCERTCATAGSSAIVVDGPQASAMDSRLSARTSLPPRPAKFIRNPHHRTPTVAPDFNFGVVRAPPLVHELAHRSGPSLSETGTKFVPTLGWCTRIRDKASQDVQYKVMLPDGSCLEMDAHLGTAVRTDRVRASGAEPAQDTTVMLKKVVDAFRDDES